MEPKLKIIWDNLLDQLEKNTLTSQYLAEKLEPFFNYLIFKTTDDLNNNLLNYSLIYKNQILLEFILNKINFNNLENEVKEKITEETFSIIIAQTKNLKENLNFLLKFLDLLKDKSFKEIGNVFVNLSPFKKRGPKRQIDLKFEEKELSPEELANIKLDHLFTSFLGFFFLINVFLINCRH